MLTTPIVIVRQRSANFCLGFPSAVSCAVIVLQVIFFAIVVAFVFQLPQPLKHSLGHTVYIGHVLLSCHITEKPVYGIIHIPMHAYLHTYSHIYKYPYWHIRIRTLSSHFYFLCFCHMIVALVVGSNLLAVWCLYRPCHR